MKTNTLTMSSRGKRLIRQFWSSRIGKLEDLSYRLAEMARKQLDIDPSDDLIMLMAIDAQTGDCFIEFDQFGRVYVDEVVL